MKYLGVILACLIILVGCTSTSLSNSTFLPLDDDKSQAVHIENQTTNPTPSPTMHQTTAPSILPDLTPLPLVTPFDYKDEFPPDLGEKTQNFSNDIMPFAHVYQPENIKYKNPYIYIKMAYRNRKWHELSELSYGNPPIPALEYLDYLWNKYHEEQPDLNFVDLDDYFFESEVLNRDMVFYIYNGSTYIGTGRITKKPELMTWHTEVEISAEFKMDDPVIRLDPSKEYLGLTKQWNPYPRNAVWNMDKTKFTIDIDGKGAMVSGKIYEAPIHEGSDQIYVYIDIKYKGEVKTYDLGYAITQPDYVNRLNFCDFDGDGIIEIELVDESENGICTIIISFVGDMPKCIYSRGYSY